MHETWMQLALAEAAKAQQKAEVPIGAVIVIDDEVIGRGHNLVETFGDPTAHAEMLAITAAAQAHGSWRLNGARLYVTVEPCPMCMGAIHLARLDALIYGAADPRLGACGSKVDLRNLDAMRVPISVTDGVLADRATALLQAFFKSLRQQK